MEVKKRLEFDSQGKLMGVDGGEAVKFKKGINPQSVFNFSRIGKGSNSKLKTVDSLEFLKERENKTVGDVFERENWSLFDNGKALQPLKFSNGKTQEDVVKEVIEMIKAGKKIIFLHGTCGTGKSAIALNIARILGKTSIIVPVKNLQKQYEEDYSGKKYLMKSGKRMKIAMITGRENHDSVIFSGKSCADPLLPENIIINEKNWNSISDYYRENPYIKNKDILPEVKNIRRLSIAPANPYWSPILPEDIELRSFEGVSMKKYKGADGKNYIFYHRKKGCSYYDQYLGYMGADVIIFNSAKYLAEMAIGRKPETEVEIIDEGDEFLDSLFNQEEINLTRLQGALGVFSPVSDSAREAINNIRDNLELEEKNKKTLGIDEEKVYKIKDTKIKRILELFDNQDLEAEILVDEGNYANRALEISEIFKGFLGDVFVTFRKEEEAIYANLVSVNLSGKIKDLMNKSKAMVFMSGTLHSREILKEVFKIHDFGLVEAETKNLGNIEINRTGLEFDCKYSNLIKENTKDEYFKVLAECVSRAKKPCLVHVHAYQDLPKNEGLLMSSERLRRIQNDDKTGRQVSMFKQGLNEVLYSTKCNRGVDFPGKTCNSIVFTKYPNPNIKGTFWQILKDRYPNVFWNFYKDKAYREFSQRIFRAVRGKNDEVTILSPDIRVLDAVREMQVNGYGK